MNKEKLNDIICESSSDYDILNDTYNYIENLEQQCKKQKEVIDIFLNKVDKNKLLLNNPDLLDLYLKIKRGVRMNKEELKKHCEKQIERCSLLRDYKHQSEHQAVLDLLEENSQLKEVIDKAIKNEEEVMYLANKVAIKTQNVEIKAVRDRLEEIFDILKEVE